MFHRVINLSASPVEASIQLSQAGEYQDYFTGEIKKLEKGSTFKLDTWGYQVLIRK